MKRIDSMATGRRTRVAYPLLPLLALGCATGPGPAPAPAPEMCPVAAERPRLDRLTLVAPVIRQQIRYATADNFTGAPLPGYEVGEALLRPAAASSLARVQRRLEQRGLGLLVWDAYRPVRATEAMVDWAERSGNEWVLDEGYVARRSNHNRGNTIDLTLVRLDSGEPLDMGTEYDHFGVESHTANATGTVLENRRVLLDAMAAEGWSNYEKEWWHFTHRPDEQPGFVDVPIACYAGDTSAGMPGPVPAAKHGRVAARRNGGERGMRVRAAAIRPVARAVIDFQA